MNTGDSHRGIRKEMDVVGVNVEAEDVPFGTVEQMEGIIDGLGRAVRTSIPYPKGVYFVIITEFFERFTYYGIASVLSSYMKESLAIPSKQVTVIKQIFLMFSYCFPLIGAMLADCWLNKFRTTTTMLPLYMLGSYVLLVSSLPFIPGIPVAMTGLVLTYLGLGGVRPCIVAFGGDQFILPQQDSFLKKYFSVFYFSINAGSFIADITVPTLSDKTCFGEDFCYTAGFGAISCAITLGALVFISGKKVYYIRKPHGNIALKMFKCICHALNKRRSAKPAEHWLDLAADKYDPDFINDVKTVLRILVLYIPLPFFRALFDQHGSRWIDQAARMSGDIGKLKLEAEQMNAANSIFILLFIPLFEAFLYPSFARYNFLRKPLQRLTVGGLLAALAYLVSALVEIQLESGDDYLPKAGEAQIRFYNGLSEPLSLEFLGPKYPRALIPSLGEWHKLNIPTSNEGEIQLRYQLNGTDRVENFKIFEHKLTSYIFTPQKVVKIEDEDSEKSKEGAPKIRVIYIQSAPSVDITTMRCGIDTEYTITQDIPYTAFEESVDCETFEVFKDGKKIHSNTDIMQGAVYIAFIKETADGVKSNVLTIVEPNSLHMLWLVPQYVLITAGEVMFSITGFEFSFTQAPVTMKAIMQAAWLLTAALGKVIVLSAGNTKLANRLFSEFMLFAAFMAIDMFIFAALAMRYKYVTTGEESGMDYNR